MRVGMLARGEDRGLGNLTWEWYRHMRPERTLLVIPAAVQKAGLTTHTDRYPDATIARWGASGMLDAKIVRPWLEGLDVVYSAETFYDWRLCVWARRAGVATVAHAMPEFTRPEWAGRVDQWWAPTSYRREELAPTNRLVPVPVPTDRWPKPRPPAVDGPLHWLHVAGAQTIEDRNGSRAVFRALHYVKRETFITIRTQDELDVGAVPKHVHVDLQIGNVDDYWTNYDGADAMLLPRRYAGLCLPVLEAMGAGLPVVMTDMLPQTADWPVSTVRTNMGRKPWRFVDGSIETGDADPHALAELMDAWDLNRALYLQARLAASLFVVANCWESMRPVYVEELERASS